MNAPCSFRFCSFTLLYREALQYGGCPFFATACSPECEQRNLFTLYSKEVILAPFEYSVNNAELSHRACGWVPLGEPFGPASRRFHKQ